MSLLLLFKMFLSFFFFFLWQVIFSSPAPLHPHIYSNGHICLGLLLHSLKSIGVLSVFDGCCK